VSDFCQNFDFPLSEQKKTRLCFPEEKKKDLADADLVGDSSLEISSEILPKTSGSKKIVLK
jgi:hypothetical protein